MIKAVVNLETMLPKYTFLPTRLHAVIPNNCDSFVVCVCQM